MRSPGRGLSIAQKSLVNHLRSYRLDMRLSWESSDGWLQFAQGLPADYNGYWMDIAAHADPDSVEMYIDWACRLRRGHITLISLKPNAEAEVSLSLPGGMSAERLDDQRFDNRFISNRPAMRVRTTMTTKAGSSSSEALDSASRRTQLAYHQLAQRVEGPFSGFQEWADESFTRFKQSLQAKENATPLPWFALEMGHLPDIPNQELEVAGHRADGVITGLTAELSDERVARSLWADWCNGLERLDLVIVRCSGTMPELESVMQEVDLYHFHPNRNRHQYGVSTLHASTQLTESKIQDLLRDDESIRGISDWDLRWSGLQFKLEGVDAVSSAESESSYVLRTAQSKTTDRFIVELPLDDPRSPPFRAARRQLAATFGEQLGSESAWEYVGPAAESALGEQYGRLREQLGSAVAAAQDDTSSLSDPRRPGVLEVLSSLRQSTSNLALKEQITQSIERALPGFRFDRKAHISDQYFLEFVRRSPGGFHLIQLQRSYQPDAFSMSLGTSLFHVPFDDLVPGLGRMTPGLTLPLTELVPEREASWVLGNQRATERQLEDFEYVLTERVCRYFELAEQALLAQTSKPLE